MWELQTDAQNIFSDNDTRFDVMRAAPCEAMFVIYEYRKYMGDSGW